MKMTGLGSRIEAKSNPFACIGDRGITIWHMTVSLTCKAHLLKYSVTHLESRSAHEEAFRTLGMIVPSMANRHRRTADCQLPNIEVSAASEPKLGCLVDNLETELVRV